MLTSGDACALISGADRFRSRHGAACHRRGRAKSAHKDPGSHVVRLTTTIRNWATEVDVPADVTAGVGRESAAQSQRVRAVSAERSSTRVATSTGSLGARRETIAVLLDL